MRVIGARVLTVLAIVLALVAPAIARGWLSALVLLALVIVGVEVVRNIALREGPHQS